MTRRSILGVFLLAMTVVGSFLSLTATAQSAAAHPADQAFFVDILYLQKGKTTEDAKGYFKKTGTVVAKHGLRRMGPPFEITKKMAGDIDPHLVNFWTVSDPKNTFNNIFKDQAYLKHIGLRNATFDMSRSHMFMLRATE